MQPDSPSVSPARGARSVALRGAFALLLALLVATIVGASPTADAACRRAVARAYPTVPVAAQPPKKEADKKDEKKEPTKPPEPKWPTDINGKDLKAVLKDLEDPDPINREYAARTLPNFGPPAQKEHVSEALIKRMKSERDPVVRFAVWGAVGSIPFDHQPHNSEALRLLAEVVDTAPSGSSSRYQAVQTLTMFGPRAYGTITKLTGVAVSDASYETRRVIANALGRVGTDETPGPSTKDTTGPNMKALTTLADVLAKDPSAAVRMEALQSLLLLGPPWAEIKKAGAKETPPFKAKDAEVIIKYMKYRVGDPKLKLVGLEKDKQVEIWARLVLMRFDPREINEDNLDAFARHLTTPEVGIKVQALQAIGMMHEAAAKKLDAVVQLLADKDMQIVVITVQTLASMGAGAKPAVPALRKLAGDMKKLIDTKKGEERKAAEDLIKLKDQERKIAEEMLRVKEHDRKIVEELVKLIESAIKYIEDAKPISPSVADPPKKP